MERTTWLYMVVTIVLLVTVIIARLWTRWLIASPLNVPISVAEPFGIERTLLLKMSDRYFLELYFDRADMPYETLRSLVGGSHGQKIEVDGHLVDAGEPAGVLVPIEWSLRKAGTGIVAASGNSRVFGSHSWSAAEAGRLLYQGDIEAGTYQFSAVLRTGVEEFRSIKARLSLSVEPMLIMSINWGGNIYIAIASLCTLVTGAIGLWKWWK